LIDRATTRQISRSMLISLFGDKLSMDAFALLRTLTSA